MSDHKWIPMWLRAAAARKNGGPIEDAAVAWFTGISGTFAVLDGKVAWRIADGVGGRPGTGSIELGSEWPVDDRVSIDGCVVRVLAAGETYAFSEDAVTRVEREYPGARWSVMGVGLTISRDRHARTRATDDADEAASKAILVARCETKWPNDADDDPIVAMVASTFGRIGVMRCYDNVNVSVGCERASSKTTHGSPAQLRGMVPGTITTGLVPGTITTEAIAHRADGFKMSAPVELRGGSIATQGPVTLHVSSWFIVDAAALDEEIVRVGVRAEKIDQLRADLVSIDGVRGAHAGAEPWVSNRDGELFVVYMRGPFTLADKTEVDAERAADTILNGIVDLRSKTSRENLPRPPIVARVELSDLSGSVNNIATICGTMALLEFADGKCPALPSISGILEIGGRQWLTMPRRSGYSGHNWIKAHLFDPDSNGAELDPREVEKACIEVSAYRLAALAPRVHVDPSGVQTSILGTYEMHGTTRVVRDWFSVLVDGVRVKDAVAPIVPGTRDVCDTSVEIPGLLRAHADAEARRSNSRITTLRGGGAGGGMLIFGGPNARVVDTRTTG